MARGRWQTHLSYSKGTGGNTAEILLQLLQKQITAAAPPCGVAAARLQEAWSLPAQPPSGQILSCLLVPSHLTGSLVLQL